MCLLEIASHILEQVILTDKHIHDSLNIYAWYVLHSSSFFVYIEDFICFFTSLLMLFLLPCGSSTVGWLGALPGIQQEEPVMQQQKDIAGEKRSEYVRCWVPCFSSEGRKVLFIISAPINHAIFCYMCNWNSKPIRSNFCHDLSELCLQEGWNFQVAGSHQHLLF
jgi:hypothetical protein